MEQAKPESHIFSDLKKTGNFREGALMDLEDYLELSRQGYRYIPLRYRLHADCLTPVGAYLALRCRGRGRRRSFLLESVEKGVSVGRYSLLGMDPLLTINCTDSGVTKTDTGGSVEVEGDPLDVLAESMRGLGVAPVENSPVFYGGAVGYLAYDYVRQLEKIPRTKPDALCLPTAFWLVPGKLICFDHVTNEITIVIMTAAGAERHYQNAAAEMERLLLELRRSRPAPPIKVDLFEAEKTTSTFKRKDFCQAVKAAKDYIFAGDIFQVVLSQRLSFPFSGDPFDFYRVLRTVNPSPYLFYVDCGNHQVVGSSPEMLARLSSNDNEAEIRPIAGTRPRFLPDRTEEELVNELTTDEKERAEHLMLVDLGRNDLGRVCQYGTVKVEEFMTVERYSHLLHLVSKVTGKLGAPKAGDPLQKALSLLRAVFPAGTLTGAPKVRAMEIIEELEPCQRGIYGGTIGYIGFDGHMDTCIAIRTAIAAEGFMHLQAGAGIVADSDPEREFQETLCKLQALLESFSLLEKGGEGWL